MRSQGGTAVNLKLSKSTPNLPQLIVALTKAYIRLGGSELQINIVDAKTFKNVQRHPEDTPICWCGLILICRR